MHTYLPLGRAGYPSPHYAYDASLLFQRMEFYQIHRACLTDIDPLAVNSDESRGQPVQAGHED